MAKFRKVYTPDQELSVVKLFNRKLRKGEKVVDNTAPTISKETGIPVSMVDKIIVKYLDEKFRILNFKINNK